MGLDYINAAEETIDNSTEVQKDFNIRLPYPKVYTVRCVDVEFGKSKPKYDENNNLIGGNLPMITRTWEVVAPETVKVPDQEAEGGYREVNIQGLKVMDWLVISPKTAKFVKQDSERLGVDMPDDERPNLQQYIGKEARALLMTNVNKMFDVETKEPILNSDGTQRCTYQHQFARDGWMK